MTPLTCGGEALLANLFGGGSSLCSSAGRFTLSEYSGSSFSSLINTGCCALFSVIMKKHLYQQVDLTSKKINCTRFARITRESQ